MIFVEILNWQALKAQAGEAIAKEISAKLRKAVLNNPNTREHALTWTDKHESVYLFELENKQRNRNIEKIYFNFTGTAS